MKPVKDQFSYIIGIVLIILLGLVIYIGRYGYGRITDVVDQVDKTSKFDGQLIKTKNLLGKISSAENSIKTYGITKESDYLDAYYTSIQEVDVLMNDLQVLKERSLSNNPLDLELLDSLINRKFEILNDYLVLQDDYRVDIALDKLVKNVESKIDDTPEEGKTENKRGKLLEQKFIKRIFRKKENGETKEEVESVELSSLDAEVKALKNQEDQIKKSKVAQELSLILDDREITQKIDSVINQFEIGEKQRITRSAERAAKEVHAINKQITLFFITAGLLVLLVIILIARYVRANKSFEKALQTAKGNAEQLAETKERFLNNMSHEIRTPMNAISGFIQQLSKSDLNEKQTEQVEIIQKSSDYLLHIIDEILVFNKLQNNRLRVDNRGFDLRGFISDLNQILEPQAISKGLKLKFFVDPNAPEILIGDPYKLNQVLINILGNAIKFTTNGGVTLRVKYIEQGPDHCRVSFEVSDTGIGMNAEQLSRVFEEFEQAEVSTTRRFGGTGLGLSITKGLVQLLDGTIDVQSQVDQGTTFQIELPFRIGNQEDTYLIRESHNDANLEGLRVLVVDDEPYNRKLLTTILSKYHMKPVEASNGREAVEEMKHNNYEIVLMDSRMPVMDGVEATRVIRKNPDTGISETPIIALSAAVEEKDQQRYKDAGMTGFLPKPFRESTLIREIARATGRKLKGEKPKTKKKSEQKDNQLDFEHLKHLSNGDEDFFQDMLKTFVETLESGLDSLKAELDQENLSMVAEYAHRVSSPCKHLSAEKLYDQLKSLEKGIRAGEVTLSTAKSLVAEIKNGADNVSSQVKQMMKKV